MSKKFILWLVSVSVIVAAAIVVVLSNSEQLTITFFPGKDFTANKGVMVLAIFLCGVAVSCFFASYFGLKTYFYERMLNSREKHRHNVYQALEQARALLAAGDWESSKKIWLQLLKHSTNEVIPQIELAKCFEGAGDLANAIKVIEQARATNPSNQEILMYSAHLHLLSGNKTVALDNVVLASYHSPTPKIFRLAREIAEEVGRIDDALDFHNELAKLNKLTENDKEIEVRLKYKKLINELRNITDNEVKKEKLNKFINSYHTSMAAEELANILCSENKLSEAGKLLLAQAKRTKQASDWKKLTDFWLAKKDTPQALTSARLALNSTEGKNKILAKLELIKLLSRTGEFETLKNQLAELKEILRQPNLDISNSTRIYTFATQAEAYLALGQEVEAKRQIQEISYKIQQDIAQN